MVHDWLIPFDTCSIPPDKTEKYLFFNFER